jgi:hypothetical protein
MLMQINISMANAAFEDEEEVPRILRRVADTCSFRHREPWAEPLPLFDSNGNRVGEVAVIRLPTERTDGLDD